jgi:membrane protein required for colicin V production
MLDIIAVIIIMLAFFRGWQKGVIVALCSLLAIVLGMLAALKLSGALGIWLMKHGWVTSGWAQIISYVLLFVGVLLLVRLLARAVEGALKMAMLGFINRLAGALLYAFIGAFIWSSLLWVGDHAHLISPEAKAHSRTFGWLSPVAPWVFAKLGAVLPFAKDVFADLSQFFDLVNQHLSGHVGAS